MRTGLRRYRVAHRNSRLANVLGTIVVLVISGLSLMQLARVLGLAE